MYLVQSELEQIKATNTFNTEIVSILGDVKDKDRVEHVIKNHRVEFYHAAAYKHVPIVEYYENITEGIKNNVFGTKIVLK